jgi:hypothetical protein
VLSVGLSAYHLGYGLREPWWSVTFSPAWKTAINLDQHRIVHEAAKRLLYSDSGTVPIHPSLTEAATTKGMRSYTSRMNV